jgi:hypothetical protein
VEQLVARVAHNHEVAGSSPAAATENAIPQRGPDRDDRPTHEEGRGAESQPRDGSPLRASTLCRIQHHPARAHLIPSLVEALGSDVEVVEDPDPYGRLRSPWRTYRECLQLPPAGITHLLVLQDDAIPCRNLLAACEWIARPDPVCLFLGGAPVRTARDASRAAVRGDRFVSVHAAEWVPVVAVLWPVEVAQEFLDWCGSNRLPGDPEPRSDDAVVGRWARRTRQPVFATVPSLVQHPDTEESLIGKRARHGRSAWRVAHSWIGDRDPLEIDWSWD